MARADTYLSEPAIHPRLLESGLRRELGEAWKAEGQLRIQDALEPGLAAELVSLLRRLPYAAHSESGIYWTCEVGVQGEPDAQIPEPFFRMVRFLDRDLPELVRAVTGQAVAPERTRWLSVRAFRKGCWLDSVSERPPGVGAVLGLTGERWPQEWGGQLQVGGRPWGSGWDTLDLFAPGVLEIPLVLRHVEALMMPVLLVPAEGGS